MNFTIKTIGCKVNTYESNKVRDELIKLGFHYIDVEDKDSYKFLDIYIVNTCSVTKIADKKSRQMLHLAKKYNPNVVVIAIGCLVDSLVVGANESIDISEFLEASSTSHINGVDYCLSNKEKDNLKSLLLELRKTGRYKSEELSIRLVYDENTSLANSNNFNTRIRAFIKIQDGCNQYCSYCIIPYLRGNITSRDDDDIVNEIKEKVKDGVKEVVLTGIHLSSFGIDRVKSNYENDGAIDIARKSLLDIMHKVAEIDGVERIRLGSLEPRIINDYFLGMIIGEDDNHLDEMQNALSKKFCANFCLSLQSGCDKTLKKMNRHYNTKDFENAVTTIRMHMPNATITTDVIVGFPGESEEDFLESLAFVKRMRFYNPNIFPYSRRKGTMADKMDNQLTFEEKHRRAKIMIEECDRITKEIETEYNKEHHDILVEEVIEKDGKKYGIGYTEEYVKMKREL